MHEQLGDQWPRAMYAGRTSTTKGQASYNSPSSFPPNVASAQVHYLIVQKVLINHQLLRYFPNLTYLPTPHTPRHTRHEKVGIVLEHSVQARSASPRTTNRTDATSNLHGIDQVDWLESKECSNVLQAIRDQGLSDLIASSGLVRYLRYRRSITKKSIVEFDAADTGTSTGSHPPISTRCFLGFQTGYGLFRTFPNLVSLLGRGLVSQVRQEAATHRAPISCSLLTGELTMDSSRLSLLSLFVGSVMCLTLLKQIIFLTRLWVFQGLDGRLRKQQGRADFVRHSPGFKFTCAQVSVSGPGDMATTAVNPDADNLADLKVCFPTIPTMLYCLISWTGCN